MSIQQHITKEDLRISEPADICLAAEQAVDFELARQDNKDAGLVAALAGLTPAGQVVYTTSRLGWIDDISKYFDWIDDISVSQEESLDFIELVHRSFVILGIDTHWEGMQKLVQLAMLAGQESDSDKRGVLFDQIREAKNQHPQIEAAFEDGKFQDALARYIVDRYNDIFSHAYAQSFIDDSDTANQKNITSDYNPEDPTDFPAGMLPKGVTLDQAFNDTAQSPQDRRKNQ